MEAKNTLPSPATTKAEEIGVDAHQGAPMAGKGSVILHCINKSRCSRINEGIRTHAHSQRSNSCSLLPFGFRQRHAYGEKESEQWALKEVVITAQKQSEDAQNIPISLTLLDSTDMDDREIDTLRDVSHYTPSLMMFNLGFSTASPPSIRGLFADAITQESTMGIYVDGVPITMGIGINDPILDIERIEILKGPPGDALRKKHGGRSPQHHHNGADQRAHPQGDCPGRQR